MKKMLAACLAAAALVTGAAGFTVPAQASAVSAVTTENEEMIKMSFSFDTYPPEYVEMDNGFYGYLVQVEEIRQGSWSVYYIGTYEGFMN